MRVAAVVEDLSEGFEPRQGFNVYSKRTSPDVLFSAAPPDQGGIAENMAFIVRLSYR